MSCPRSRRPLPCGGYLRWRFIVVCLLICLTLYLSARCRLFLYLHEGGKHMQIDILYFEGCPHHIPTVERVKQIVAEMGLTIPVTEVQITTPEEAQQRRFLGSPT